MLTQDELKDLIDSIITAIKRIDTSCRDIDQNISPHLAIPGIHNPGEKHPFELSPKYKYDNIDSIPDYHTEWGNVLTRFYDYTTSFNHNLFNKDMNEQKSQIYISRSEVSNHLFEISKILESNKKQESTLKTLKSITKDLQSKLKSTENKISETIANKNQKDREHEKLLSDKAEIISGMTLKEKSFVLQKSVEVSKEGVVKSLINEKFDINFQNKLGKSLLHTSIISGHQNLIKKLLESISKLEVNLLDKDGSTPLHYLLKGKDFHNKSTQDKWLPLLKELLLSSSLKEKASILIENNSGVTPQNLLEEHLFKAINHGGSSNIDLDFITFLTKLSLNIGEFDLKNYTHSISSPLYLSIKNNIQAAKILLALKNQSSKLLKQKSLFEIIKSDDLSTLKKLEAILSIDFTKLKYPSKWEKILSKDFVTSCYEAINLDSNKVTAYILQNYSKDHYKSMIKESLFDAARNNNLKVLKKLLQLDGSLIRHKDKEGNDLLSFAINSDSSEFIDYLLSKGLNIAYALSGDSVSKINLHGKRLDNDDVQTIADLIENNPNKIKVLDLSKIGLQRQGLELLSNAIEFNQSVKVVNISENNLNKDSIAYLASSLWNNGTVKTLNLSKNFFGSDGVISVASILEDNKSVTHLNLSSNSIGSVGARSLVDAFKVNDAIKALNLSSNNLTFSGAYYLSQGLSHSNIRFLDLSNNDFKHNGGIMVSNIIKNAKSLIYLNLSKNNIGDVGIVYIAKALLKNKSLASVDISENNLSSSREKLLSDLMVDTNSISYLNLSKNPLVRGSLNLMIDSFKNNAFLTLKLLGIEKANGKIKDMIKTNNSKYNKFFEKLNKNKVKLKDYEAEKIVEKLFGLFKQIQGKLIDISNLSIDNAKEKSAAKLIDNLLQKHKMSDSSNDDGNSKDLQDQFDYEFGNM